jgi:multiple sugar transport system ATP-binding protein
MNFFDGEMVEGGVLLAGGVRLPLARPVEAGRKVVFGIRPEHIALRKEGHEGRAPVPAQTEVVEPLGSRTIVTARTAAGVLQLEAEAMPGLKPGDALTLWFEMPRVHLFDQATESVL